MSGSRNNSFGNANDSAGKRTNTSNWENEDAQIYYTTSFSKVKQAIDTQLSTFHRRPFSQPWYRDLGNLGSPTMNLLFTPNRPLGISLGYHSFDAMRFVADSMKYYNTTKPYSNFTFNLGSKLEQRAEIFHTQNIKPYWNMAVNYRKINSPGHYFTQRNNHDNFFWTTHYESPSKHYELYATATYNKHQHDENGGIRSDAFLEDPQFSDRKAIPTNFFSSGFSNTRSAVTTLQRDFTILLEHAYTWGKRDTLFNEDSTRYDLRLKPRFRITHRAEMGSQRYQFKDVRPDSLRYVDFFQQRFPSGDSVFLRQEWRYVDNRFLLNGLLGKPENQIVFNAGVGLRIDQFSTRFIGGESSQNVLGNYLVGNIRKEAGAAHQWGYEAKAQLFVTGAAAGNFLLQGLLSKDLGNKWGAIQIGATQQLNNAPYNFTIFQHKFWSRTASFNQESATRLFAQIHNPKYKFSIGFSNYLMSNYLYFDASQNPAQHANAFTISQLSLRKQFAFGVFRLDNELLYQQKAASAPVNVPQWLGRHQLYVESAIFKNQLKIATGLELRYHSQYFANGYEPLFNQFYFQNSYLVRNGPDGSVFFNFNIKRFRAYFMFDQVPQMFQKNIIISQGYAAQNAMLRFGFSWVMVN